MDSTIIHPATKPESKVVPFPSVRPALCAFTVDVEDWYQSCIDFDAPISERVVRNTERVLAMLDECRTKGTFFVQGRVAETFPQLLRDMLAAGHEIQSHAYSHRPLFSMNRHQLRKELELSRKSVEDACGAQVTAFRAPDFSILKDNLWALDVLAETGFTIDSSIFPMRMRRYGVAGWLNAPQKLSLPNGQGLWEVPVAIWSWGRFKLPVAGGGYFRLLPRRFISKAFNAILDQDRPVILYCHPYEFNATELNDFRGKAPWKFLRSQELGRATFGSRMRSLLQEMPFGRFDHVLAKWGIN
jgi:polysaccharide deacetylase family protein (PEP-CTERM system associated)